MQKPPASKKSTYGTRPAEERQSAAEVLADLEAAAARAASGAPPPIEEAPAEKKRGISLKWYYLLTAALGVITLLGALYGATRAIHDASAALILSPTLPATNASPLYFIVPFLGIILCGIILFLFLNALCAFKLLPEGSYRITHFILNLILYLAIVLGWPLLIAGLQVYA